MLNYLTVNTFVEFICFVFTVLCLTKDTSFVWRSMIIYLFITCVAEVVGIYVFIHTQSQNNHWLYNIFLVCEAGFTSLMFAHLLSKYINSKPIVIIGLALLCLFYIADIVKHGFFVYNNQTYTEMSVLFVLYSLYYYYLLLVKEDNYIRIKYSASFWWVTGALFFYFGNTVCNIFDNILYSDKLKIFNHHLTYYIFRILNIIQYGCWSYSFICRKWLTTTSGDLS